MDGTQIAIAVGGIVAVLLVLRFLLWLLGFQIIGNTEIGVVEKKWGGGALKGKIIALNGETGFQPDVIRGGIHFLRGYQYKIHKVPLITIHRGQIGYIFARDGLPLGQEIKADGSIVTRPGQALARVVNCGDFTDVRKFLNSGGQQGMQLAVLREGTYAINTAQFAVICGPRELYYLSMGNRQEEGAITNAANLIAQHEGFTPVVIDGKNDSIGIVTVHDGPSLPQNDIIAPTVGDSVADPHYHNNFQDAQAFLEAGGYRGRQYQVLTEGTYWIYRLFATVELIGKTVVEIGYVGVVVSYYGEKGADTSGADFRHGELCKKGGRGIWDEALLPGKYPFNTYAGEVVMVPTTNIILKWIRGEVDQAHKLDENLNEIELITKDAFEPLLPLSVVISIDYQKAPHVVQRFGSVKGLIEQSLDPMVASYFKNEGQSRTLIELIQQRSEIQIASTTSMKAKFLQYDLQLQEVLIGTPEARQGDNLMESILSQLRERQAAVEKALTYKMQEEAANAERSLNEANARALKQQAITDSQLQIQIETNQGEAAAKRAEQTKLMTVTNAEAKAAENVIMAEAEKKTLQLRAEVSANAVRLQGQAEADKAYAVLKAQADGTARQGLAEALATAEKRNALGSSSKLVTRDIAIEFARALRDVKQPLVPRTVIGGGDGKEGGDHGGLFGMFANMILAKRLGIVDDDDDESEEVLSPQLAAYRAELDAESKSKSEAERPAQANQSVPAAPAKRASEPGAKGEK